MPGDNTYSDIFDKKVDLATDATQAAERELVGHSILDSSCFHEAALKYSQFSDPVCAIAWKAIGELLQSNSDVDPISVSDATNGKISPSQLSSMLLNIGSPNILNHANLVRDSFVARGVATISADFSSWRDYGISGAEMLSKVQAKLDKLQEANSVDLPTLASVAKAEANRILNTPPEELVGLPTGLGIEKVVPGGIPRGKVTTLFGESGNFKTTVKNNIVLGIASAGYRVLDCSFEDADELTAHRYIARRTGVNYGKISAGTLASSERSSLEELELGEASENVILAGSIVPNIDEIIRRAREQNTRTAVDAVVIDYVQLLEGRNPRQSPKELLDEIMRKSQLAAKRDNMAYIIVSQVKQDVDTRTDHRPRITDMLGSSAMRTASKLSIGVYRPSLYEKVPGKQSPYRGLYTNHPDGERVYRGLLELHFLKNVLGEPLVVVHCLVNAGTGSMQPFNMSEWS